MTKKLRSLEAAGFVKREHDPDDKRVFCFLLTDYGRQVLDQLNPIYEASVQSLFTGVSEKDLESGFSVLQRLLKNLEMYGNSHNPAENLRD